MGARWMQAKLAKMKAERPPFNPATTQGRAGHTLERSRAISAELATLVACYTGVVTKCETKRAPDTWRKRGGSTLGQLPRNHEVVFGATRAAPGMKAIVERQTWEGYARALAEPARIVRR